MYHTETLLARSWSLLNIACIITEWLSPRSGRQLFWIIWRRWGRTYQLWLRPKILVQTANCCFVLRVLPIFSLVALECISIITFKFGRKCGARVFLNTCGLIGLFSSEHDAPLASCPCSYNTTENSEHIWVGNGWEIEVEVFIAAEYAYAYAHYSRPTGVSMRKLSLRCAIT